MPDGWYGRPYDNQHALTSVIETDTSLTLILDSSIELHFEGLNSVRVQNRELVLGPFDRFVFTITRQPTVEHQSPTNYTSGEVKVVPAPG